MVIVCVCVCSCSIYTPLFRWPLCTCARSSTPEKFWAVMRFSEGVYLNFTLEGVYLNYLGQPNIKNVSEFCGPAIYLKFSIKDDFVLEKTIVFKHSRCLGHAHLRCPSLIKGDLEKLGQTLIMNRFMSRSLTRRKKVFRLRTVKKAGKKRTKKRRSRKRKKSCNSQACRKKKWQKGAR